MKAFQAACFLLAGSMTASSCAVRSGNISAQDEFALLAAMAKLSEAQNNQAQNDNEKHKRACNGLKTVHEETLCLAEATPAPSR